FRDIALNLRRRTVALPGGVAEEPAGARVHRRRKHESSGKGDRSRGARNRGGAVFERLAHHFEDVALELRQFIEKKHAVVAQRNFSWAGNRAAADQAGIADGVWGGAERPRADKPARVVEQSRYTVDARRLDGLFERHR